MPASYGLFGYPVQHSWSPFIHGMFAKQTAQDMEYRLFESPPERFRSEVLEFFRTGGSGVNVTVPHKRAATDLVNELTPRAQVATPSTRSCAATKASSATTPTARACSPTSPATCGLNFPRPGSCCSAPEARHAGRSVRCWSCSRACSSIANRTAERAMEIAEEFAYLGPVSGCEFARLENQRFDLIINATSASLRGDVPAIPAGVVDSLTTCYDMAYGSGDTAFMAWAKAPRRRPRRTGLGHAGRAGRRGVFPVARRAAGHGACARGAAQRAATKAPRSPS